MKKLFLMIMALFAGGVSAAAMESRIIVPQRNMKLPVSMRKVHKGKEIFLVRDDGQLRICIGSERYKIPAGRVDKKIRSLSNKQFKRFLKGGGILQVITLSGNQYAIKATGSLSGGSNTLFWWVGGAIATAAVVTYGPLIVRDLIAFATEVPARRRSEREKEVFCQQADELVKHLSDYMKGVEERSANFYFKDDDERDEEVYQLVRLKSLCYKCDHWSSSNDDERWQKAKATIQDLFQRVSRGEKLQEMDLSKILPEYTGRGYYGWKPLEDV